MLVSSIVCSTNELEAKIKVQGWIQTHDLKADSVPGCHCATELLGLNGAVHHSVRSVPPEVRTCSSPTGSAPQPCSGTTSPFLLCFRIIVCFIT